MTIKPFLLCIYLNLLFVGYIFAASHGELIIKIGSDSGYEDGDVIHAFNARRILQVNTEMITNPVKMARTDKRINPGSLLEIYCENVKQYKFIRIGKGSVRRVDLSTGSFEVLSNTPNDNGEYIDVQSYIARRLRLKPDRNLIFGNAGSEYWYGGRISPSNEKLAVVWDQIEASTNLSRAENQEFPFTARELKGFYVMSVEDFSDTQSNQMVSPVLSLPDEKGFRTVVKARSRMVDIGLIGLTPRQVDTIRDKSISKDQRKSRSFLLSSVKVKS